MSVKENYLIDTYKSILRMVLHLTNEKNLTSDDKINAIRSTVLLLSAVARSEAKYK